MFLNISKLLLNGVKTLGAGTTRQFHLLRRYDPWRMFDEDRTYRLLLDVEEFNPKDIDVTVDSGKIKITAHKYSDHKHWRDSTQILREYDIPTDVDSQSIKSKIDSGLLIVEGDRRVTGDAHHVKDDTNYIMKVDMNGFDPKNVSITQNGNEFTIEAKQDVQKMEGDQCVSKCLRSFRRTFTLPENVDNNELKAKFTNDGRLVLTSPYIKGETHQKKQIQIEHE